MPELPEVETIKNDLITCCLNKTVKKVYIYQNHLRYKIDKNIMNIENKKFIYIKRYSKYILIKFNNKNYILIHLGMSGNIYILNKNTKITKHDHIDIILNNKKIIRYNDIRKFGFFLWYKNKKKIQSLLNKLGPEPLSKNFNTKYLYNITKKRTLCIHNLIMNNKIISGIGNIYANECLYYANILPYKPSNKLKPKNIKQLVKYIKKILKKSILLKGTTIRNYKCLNKNPGLFQNKLKVYGRKNKQCYKCNHIIQSIKKYNRSLFFCKKCQK